MTRPLLDLGFLFYHASLVLPGFLAARVMLRRRLLTETADAAIVGYALGYSWAILANILLLHFDMPVLVLPGLSLAIAPFLWIAGRREMGTSPDKEIGGFAGDQRFAFWVGVSVVAVTLIVVLRVGRVEDGRHVYPALFAYDYFNHIAVTAELAKHVPPRNIYYAGPLAHYYWFFHVVPAAYHRLAAYKTDIRDLLVLLDAVNIVFLFLSLGALLKRTGVSGRAVRATLLLLTLCYSYIGLFIIGRDLGDWTHIARGFPAIAGAWNKLEGYSGLSHGFMRDFWVEPHATAAIFLVLVTILLQRSLVGRMAQMVRGLLIGVLTLVAIGCDSFLGIILATWIAVDTLLDVIGKRLPWKQFALRMIGICAAAIIGLSIVVGFQIIGGQGRMLRFVPFVPVVYLVPFYLAFDDGPLFILGVWGWWLILRRRRADGEMPLDRVALFGAISLAAGLFIRHRIEYDLVLRKSGIPIQLMLLIGCAYQLNGVMAGSRRSKIITALVVVLALPSIALDFQAFGGIAGSRGLRNTVTVEEMNALRWIKANTDPQAIVQGLPGYQGEYLYELNPIPPFAERGVAVGTYMLAALWGIGGGPAIERQKEIDAVFTADDVRDIRPTLDKYGIDYLFVGPHERAAYNLTRKVPWRLDPSFNVVYDESEVVVIRYTARSPRSRS